MIEVSRTLMKSEPEYQYGRKHSVLELAGTEATTIPAANAGAAIFAIVGT